MFLFRIIDRYFLKVHACLGAANRPRHGRGRRFEADWPYQIFKSLFLFIFFFEIACLAVFLCVGTTAER